jgi:hypothetical protein
MMVVAMRYHDSKTFAENGLADYFVSLLHAAGHSHPLLLHRHLALPSVPVAFCLHPCFQTTPIGQLNPTLPLQRGPESNA